MTASYYELLINQFDLVNPVYDVPHTNNKHIRAQRTFLLLITDASCMWFRTELQKEEETFENFYQMVSAYI